MLFIAPLQSQDLEPRFLSSVPLKTNFSGLVYGYSHGDILLNAQEIEGLNAKLNSVAVFYGSTSVQEISLPDKDIAGIYLELPLL